MNKPTHIIIHCTDSKWGCAREIRKWHIQRGFNDVGYHFIILNGTVEPEKRFITMEGSIECGRDLDSDGAHCLGYNDTSIGICLVGDGVDSFVIEQFSSLKKLVQELCIKFSIPVENILGHGETESGKKEGKTCPNFSVADIRTWIKGKI